MNTEEYGKLVDEVGALTNKQLANRMMMECHDAPLAQRALMIEAAFRLEKLKGQVKPKR
jgi:hypothetical protein